MATTCDAAAGFKIPEAGRAASDRDEGRGRRTRTTGTRGVFAPLACVLLTVATGVRAAPPTENDVHQAYEAVEPYVRELAKSIDAADLGELALEGVAGCAVTLRMQDRVIGRGVSMRPGAAGLAAAAGLATDAAYETLSLSTPLPRDRMAIGFGPAIRIGVELACEPRALGVRRYVEASQRLSPWIEGIAFDPGGDRPFAERVEAVFPSMMRAAGLEAGPALQGAVDRALNRPATGRKPLAEVLEELSGPRVIAFSSVEVVQVDPTADPVLVVRGARVIEAVPDRARLVRLAERLASKLSELGARGGFAAAAHTAFVATPGVDREAWPKTPPARDGDRNRDDEPLDLYEQALAGEDVTARLSRIALDVGVAGLPDAMPWLGLAARELATDGTPIPLEPVLLELGDLIDRHRLTEQDVPGPDRDLRGGVVFTGLRNPLPDWRTAKVVAWQAAALGEPSLAPDAEVAASDLLESLRFLEQLVMTEVEVASGAAQAGAEGLVRRSLWDKTPTIQGTCLTLIAVCEALSSLEKRGLEIPLASD